VAGACRAVALPGHRASWLLVCVARLACPAGSLEASLPGGTSQPGHTAWWVRSRTARHAWGCSPQRLGRAEDFRQHDRPGDVPTLEHAAEVIDPAGTPPAGVRAGLLKHAPLGGLRPSVFGRFGGLGRLPAPRLRLLRPATLQRPTGPCLPGPGSGLWGRRRGGDRLPVPLRLRGLLLPRRRRLFGRLLRAWFSGPAVERARRAGRLLAVLPLPLPALSLLPCVAFGIRAKMTRAMICCIRFSVRAGRPPVWGGSYGHRVVPATSRWRLGWLLAWRRRRYGCSGGMGGPALSPMFSRMDVSA